ncbi:MAG TPA: FmdB family zinc ribbon protein [Actinomycetota bacterium]|nr:FmdB family zinc ribbon protein [Actinomycetota bacterium]
MPTYEYACKSCGQHVEVVQSFKDDPLKTCAVCGGPLRKVFGSIGIAFKGSGFYRNDSRPAASSSEKASSEKASSDKGSSDKGSSDKGSSDKGTSAKGPAEKGSSSAPSSDKGGSSGSKGDSKPATSSAS